MKKQWIVPGLEELGIRSTMGVTGKICVWTPRKGLVCKEFGDGGTGSGDEIFDS